MKCARGFSTKSCRKEINEKVRVKLRGKKCTRKLSQRRSRRHISTWTSQSAAKLKLTIQTRRQHLLETLQWSEYTDTLRRHVILTEQDGRCNRCKLDTWLGSKLTLELEHKDGNHFNNQRENLEFLCPNCHSQTASWRGRNQRRNVKVDDACFIDALRSTENIRHALIKLGLTPRGNNYRRAHALINEHKIIQGKLDL